MCAAMSLPFIPTACETSETWVYCLFPPCWRLGGFLCGFSCGELCFRMFANADVEMSLVYFCMCVCVFWVCSVLLNFQRIQTVHTLLQHITLWHPVLGMVHAVLTQLSPSLLHFPLLFFYWELSFVAQYTLSFVGGCILLEFSWGGVFLSQFLWATNW